MAIVIDIFKDIENKKSLPFEGFFIDTNILIICEDPFSKTSYDRQTEELNIKYTLVLARLKQLSYQVFTTPSVALEYYNYVRYNHYTFTLLEKGKLDMRDFKKQRDNNPDFMIGWDLHMKKFKKIFRSKYRFFPGISYKKDLIETFDFNTLDFGDHLILNAIGHANYKNKAIFTNDKDFYSVSDDFYLLTLDKNLIKLAKKEGKLFS